MGGSDQDAIGVKAMGISFSDLTRSSGKRCQLPSRVPAVFGAFFVIKPM